MTDFGWSIVLGGLLGTLITLSILWVLGPGFLQTSKPLEDMAELVIYRSTKDGQLVARAKDEFVDGRFEELKPDTKVIDKS
jgi:hypothetical protein